MGADARMLHKVKTDGPGGIHCPCCGPRINARTAEKREWRREVERDNEQR